MSRGSCFATKTVEDSVPGDLTTTVSHPAVVHFHGRPKGPKKKRKALASGKEWRDQQHQTTENDAAEKEKAAAAESDAAMTLCSNIEDLKEAQDVPFTISFVMLGETGPTSTMEATMVDVALPIASALGFLVGGGALAILVLSYQSWQGRRAGVCWLAHGAGDGNLALQSFKRVAGKGGQTRDCNTGAGSQTLT